MVSVEENPDEYITVVSKVSKINESRNDMEIDLEEEQKTEAYKSIMNIEIENINKIETIYNHNKTNRMTIYKVMRQSFFY